MHSLSNGGARRTGSACGRLALAGRDWLNRCVDMDPLIAIAVILGVVEGLTEFLPVSSTGHLILAGHALRFTGAIADVFEIVIQAGAMLAVMVAYRGRLAGFFISKQTTGLSGRRGWALIALTSAPALMVGFVLHHAIKEHLFKPVPVAMALVVGAVAILIVESISLKARTDSVDGLTWRQALGIGLFQCLALWPGMSRSAATILGGMILGLDRKTSVEYSFLAAIPVIGAATGYDCYKAVHGGLLQLSAAPMFITGLVVSCVTAWLTIRLFLNYVSARTLRPFAIYRLILAAAVLRFFSSPI